MAQTRTNYYVLGFSRSFHQLDFFAAGLQKLESQLPQEYVWLSGWELLGHAIFSSVKKNMWKLFVSDDLIGVPFAIIGVSGGAGGHAKHPGAALQCACLLSIMRLAGWSWNLLNLMALPLILGTGVDYSIFMQLALRRYHGDRRRPTKL